MLATILNSSSGDEKSQNQRRTKKLFWRLDMAHTQFLPECYEITNSSLAMEYEIFNDSSLFRETTTGKI